MTLGTAARYCGIPGARNRPAGFPSHVVNCQARFRNGQTRYASCHEILRLWGVAFCGLQRVVAESGVQMVTSDGPDGATCLARTRGHESVQICCSVQSSSALQHDVVKVSWTGATHEIEAHSDMRPGHMPKPSRCYVSGQPGPAQPSSSQLQTWLASNLQHFSHK
jgi:hypothetical protein